MSLTKAQEDEIIARLEKFNSLAFPPDKRGQVNFFRLVHTSYRFEIQAIIELIKQNQKENNTE